MAPAAPQLPPRFPCWCRAVYSWGGETKRDLGFVEGDLIECLNAGDGQWWMGRLRRDRRMAGLFPSNFVEVLREDFVPVNRPTSPMVKAGPSPITNPTAAPKKQKTVFRKPFQAHKEALAPSGDLTRNNTTLNSLTASSIPPTPPAKWQSSKKCQTLADCDQLNQTAKLFVQGPIPVHQTSVSRCVPPTIPRLRRTTPFRTK